MFSSIVGYYVKHEIKRYSALSQCDFDIYNIKLVKPFENDEKLVFTFVVVNPSEKNVTFDSFYMSVFVNGIFFQRYTYYNRTVIPSNSRVEIPIELYLRNSSSEVAANTLRYGSADISISGVINVKTIFGLFSKDFSVTTSMKKRRR